MRRSRVLIVDDSALMRQLLAEVLASDPELEVAGAASNPLQALEWIGRDCPDVITLDVHMPRMDGLTFLEKLMRVQPLPVVMVSSETGQGCETTLRALELGAVDFVCKPGLDLERGIQMLAAELIAKVKTAAAARVKAAAPKAVVRPATPPAPVWREAFTRMVAIGASTGGTEAIREVLTAMPSESPAVLIVQHMPEHFTLGFANRLNALCPFEVREAQDNDLVQQGRVLIAPGNRHMRLVRSDTDFRVRLDGSDPVNRHRPSVDVLFQSCAEAGGGRMVGAILTGMGADGAAGMLAMRLAGAITVAQDENSCVVFGMPREAIAKGGVCRVLPLNRIGPALLMAARA